MFATRWIAVALLLVMTSITPTESLACQAVSVSGTVRRDSATAIGGALITLDPGPQVRLSRSSNDGRFAFANVPPGRHELRVIASGYAEATRVLEVGTSDTNVVVVLRVLPRIIDSVVVTASRSGVYGFVADRNDLKALEGASVQVIGARAEATTDASGKFNLPKVASGRSYVIRVVRDGYESRTVPITIPPQRGYEFGVFLEPSAEHRSNHQDGMWREFDSRVHEGGFASVLIPREELGTNGRGSPLTTMLRARSLLLKDLRFHPAALGNPGDPSYPCIWVDGFMMSHGWSLDALSVDDILAIEVYGYGSAQDRRLKSTRGDVKPVEGEPPCGQFRGMASPADETDPMGGRIGRAHLPAPIHEINPRQMIGSIVIWLKH